MAMRCDGESDARLLSALWHYCVNPIQQVIAMPCVNLLPILRDDSPCVFIEHLPISPAISPHAAIFIPAAKKQFATNWRSLAYNARKKSIREKVKYAAIIYNATYEELLRVTKLNLRGLVVFYVTHESERTSIFAIRHAITSQINTIITFITQRDVAIAIAALLDYLLPGNIPFIVQKAIANFPSITVNYQKRIIATFEDIFQSLAIIPPPVCGKIGISASADSPMQRIVEFCKNVFLELTKGDRGGLIITASHDKTESASCNFANIIITNSPVEDTDSRSTGKITINTNTIHDMFITAYTIAIEIIPPKLVTTYSDDLELNCAINELQQNGGPQ